MLKKNYVKEMVEKTNLKNSWHPDLVIESARLLNIYTYGQHIEMHTLDKDGSLIVKDITKEFLNHGVHHGDSITPPVQDDEITK
jgi:hypothetical protein